MKSFFFNSFLLDFYCLYTSLSNAYLFPLSVLKLEMIAACLSQSDFYITLPFILCTPYLNTNKC